MTEAPTLFDAPAHAGRVRATDRETSADASRSTQAGSTRALILEALRHGPATDDELVARIPGKNPPTVKTARSALTTEGWIEPTGRMKPSDCGRDMTVWKLA